MLWAISDKVVSDAAAQYKVLSDELGMTMVALKSHPKVYWIWNHRRWCLERIPDTPPSGVDSPSSPSWSQAAWEKELYFVEKMLDVDPRNCQSKRNPGEGYY